MTGKTCAQCGATERVRVASADGHARLRWHACRRCLHTTTALDRRAHAASALSRRVRRALLDGYEVWTSDAHVFFLVDDEAASLRDRQDRPLVSA